MKEATLKYAAVFCSILGLALVYIASTTLSTASIPTDRLSMRDIGKAVKVCGEIESKRVSKGHIFFTLSDGYGNINVAVFNSTAIRLNNTGTNLYSLKQGGYACAAGRLAEYPEGSGTLEIIYGG